MSAIIKISEAMRNQLFASISKENNIKFKEDIFSINMSRFAVQSFCIVILDLISLLLYLRVYSIKGEVNVSHILIHLYIISLMAFLLLYFSKLSTKNYAKTSFVEKNMDIIYPVVHGILEFILFFIGPQDFGALVRLFIVPTIMGSIPIINQKKSFVLILSAMLVQIFYIFRYSKSEFNYYSYSILVFNILIVVALSSYFISCIVYSAYVNNFTLKIKDSSIKDKLMILNKKLEFILRSDQLTGLSNLRDLESFIETTWAKVVLENMKVSVVLIDIDFFKRYNENYGRIKGDNCIKLIAETLKNKLEDDENYFLARYERQEFIIFVYDKEFDEVLEKIDDIKNEIEMLKIENPRSSVSPYVTISAGVGYCRLDENVKKKEIIELADKCLYYAKQNGRNKIISSKLGSKVFKDFNGEVIAEETKQKSTAQGISFKNDIVKSAMKEIGADCTFIYYKKQGILEFSEMAVEIFDLPNNIVEPSISKVIEYFDINKDEKNDFISKVEESIKNKNKFFIMEAQVVLPDGKRTTLLVNIKFIYDGNNLEVASGILVNIEEALQYNKYIQKESMINSITLLPSRIKFYSDMKVILKKEDLTGFIILIDIENFKMINSMYSHSIGDKVLLEVATVLKKLTNKYGSIYNYAIDQFIVILEKTSVNNATKFIEQVQEYFKNQNIIVDGLSIKISFSMGAVEITKNCTDINELLIDLDITVQKVKFEDRHGYAFFSEEDKKKYIDGLSLEKEISEAVENNYKGFIINYQPIISVKTKKCIGAEALLRWRNKEGKIVSPIEVIPVLENTGLMAIVENWIFNETCKTCAYWISKGASPDFFIQVNLSVVQIARSTLIDEVREAIERYDLSLKNILLEVTESSVMLEMNSTINTLDFLRKMGVKIAVDDFGTGYSSLSYLRSLPIDEIKIDRSFLTNIETDQVAKDFLMAIIDMSKSMGYIVCTEGVETEGQSEILSKFKVDYFQGFYFSKPIASVDLFEKFILPELKEKQLKKQA